jgi:hypothetical protein
VLDITLTPFCLRISIHDCIRLCQRIFTAIEKIEKATAATAGLPRAAEAETLIPTGRPRAAEDARAPEGETEDNDQ